MNATLVNLFDLNYLRPEAGDLVSVDVPLRKYGRRRPALVAVCHKMYAEALKLAAPVSAFKAFPSDDLRLVSTRLPGARLVALGLCTIGPALEDMARSLFEEDPAAAVILDELGNKFVGELARRAHLALRRLASEQGLRAGPAFRPGIGHWPVEFQPLILERLSAPDLGISLSDGLMMIPQKSISFAVALGHSLGRSLHP